MQIPPEVAWKNQGSTAVFQEHFVAILSYRNLNEYNGSAWRGKGGLVNGIRQLRVFLLISCCLAFFSSAQESVEMNELRVLREEGTVYMRSHFSEKEDLVVKMGFGTNKQVNFNGALLINASAPMDAKSLKAGKIIAASGDDSTPWNINGTYIGANHGNSAGFEILSEGHGRTAEDLGSEWADAKGNKFYLIKIISSDRLMFLGSNKPSGNIWRFGTRHEGNSFTSASRNATVNFTERKMKQVVPACRIKKQEYLVDGKTPLQEGEPVTCKWLDIVEEYDIINTGSLLADVIANPGQERNFIADHLDGVISNNITYRFLPNGANVIYYRAKALQEFRMGYMGFIQANKLYKGKYETYEYYIPKTVPFIKDGIDYDFCGIQDFSSRPPSPLVFSDKSKNINDPANLPDRFIHFLGIKEGDKTVREVGFAMGYSLIHGMTVPSVRTGNVKSAITLYTSSKSFPVAVDSKMGTVIPKDTDFYCVAYRHYFNPRLAGNATSLYWQKQEDDTVVYLDYHKSVDKDTVKLPGELTVKKLEVVEKSPSLVLHTLEKIPAEGISVSVTGNYGYLVLKVF